MIYPTRSISRLTLGASVLASVLTHTAASRAQDPKPTPPTRADVLAEIAHLRDRATRIEAELSNINTDKSLERSLATRVSPARDFQFATEVSRGPGVATPRADAVAADKANALKTIRDRESLRLLRERTRVFDELLLQRP